MTRTATQKARARVANAEKVLVHRARYQAKRGARRRQAKKQSFDWDIGGKVKASIGPIGGEFHANARSRRNAKAQSLGPEPSASVFGATTSLKPMFAVQSSGYSDSVLVRGQERLTDIGATGTHYDKGTVMATFDLNPMLLGSRLPTYATMYDRFCFVEAKFVYVPRLPITAASGAGEFVAAVDYDPGDAILGGNPADVDIAFAWEGSVAFSTYARGTLECRQMDPKASYYIHPTEKKDTEERFSVQARFYLLASTAIDVADIEPGTLYLQYLLRLYIPHQSPTGSMALSDFGYKRFESGSGGIGTTALTCAISTSNVWTSDNWTVGINGITPSVGDLTYSTNFSTSFAPSFNGTPSEGPPVELLGVLAPDGAGIAVTPAIFLPNGYKYVVHIHNTMNTSQSVGIDAGEYICLSARDGPGGTHRFFGSTITGFPTSFEQDEIPEGVHVQPKSAKTENNVWFGGTNHTGVNEYPYVSSVTTYSGAENSWAIYLNATDDVYDQGVYFIPALSKSGIPFTVYVDEDVLYARNATVTQVTTLGKADVPPNVTGEVYGHLLKRKLVRNRPKPTPKVLVEKTDEYELVNDPVAPRRTVSVRRAT